MHNTAAEEAVLSDSTAAPGPQHRGAQQPQRGRAPAAGLGMNQHQGVMSVQQFLLKDPSILYKH